MAPLPYFGTYCRFTTKTKKDGSTLIGADNLVGDLFEIEFIREGNDDVAWMRNRLGALVGFFDQDITHELAICKAKDMDTRAILASVWFTEQPEPGTYWGEAVLVCSPKSQAESFDEFARGLGKMIADGVRPNVVLSAGNVEKVVETKGAWMPTERTPKLDKQGGSAILKDHRTFSENMIEKARERNLGCMIGGWAALIACVVFVVLALRSCGAF